MNNRKYKKWAQWKPQANSVGTYLSQIKRTITVLLESSVEQQEIKEMGPMEATSKKHGTGYVLVSKKENIWLSSYYSSISSVVRSPRASSADAGRGSWRNTRR